jgi:hypothetical protein
VDRRHFVLATLAAASAVAPPAWAREAPPEVVTEVPGARLIGTARLRWFGLQVYDARLWAGAEAPVGAARADYTQYPLALEIEYARSLQGSRIAQQSIEEMRRGGSLADAKAQEWLAFLKQTLPDVKEQDRITGVQRPLELSRFHVNGRWVGELRDAEFMRLFFGIWLGPQSSQPAMRARLLGLSS